MSRGSLSVSEVLDDAADLAGRLFAPWVGGLWLTAAPLRLLQVHFAGRLLELGTEARSYGNHLHGIALAVLAAFVVATLGRAFYARACRAGLRSPGAPGREVFRGTVAGLSSYLYAALLIETLSFVTIVSPALLVLVGPFFVLLAGLCAATSPLVTEAGLLTPFRALFRHAGQARMQVALVVVFAMAFGLCMLNLHFAFQAALWLLQGVPGLDLSIWQVRLSLHNPGLWLVLAAGGSLLVEPYWLAALVVYVHKVQSRESGEDLRQWFEALRTGERAA